MRKPGKPNPRKLKMTQRVSQKYTIRYVIVGSSILGCMMAALIVVNLSNNESSYANEQNIASTVNYRSVETNLNSRMLLDANTIQQIQSQEYKGNSAAQSVRIPSRANDVITKNIETIITE